MRKFKALACISVLCVQYNSQIVSVQAGPVRPTLKSVVYKIVGGNQVAPYGLSLSQRRLWSDSASSRLTPPGDGERPSTSSTLVASTSVITSTSVTSSLKLSGSLIQNDGEVPSTSSGITASASTSGTSLSKSSSVPSGEIKLTPGVKLPPEQLREVLLSRGIRTKKSFPKDLVPGQAIYKQTYDKGAKVKGAGPRPHLILSVKESSRYENSTEVMVVDMSKLKGKNYPMGGPNFVINRNNPDFSSYENAAFVKLNKGKRLTLPNNQLQGLLGKIVDENDLKEIRKRLRERYRWKI